MDLKLISIKSGHLHLFSVTKKLHFVVIQDQVVLVMSFLLDYYFINLHSYLIFYGNSVFVLKHSTAKPIGEIGRIYIIQY